MINKFGVEISESEYNQLKKLVKLANAKRNRLLRKERELPFRVAGVDKGVTVFVGRMGEESDFIIREKKLDIDMFRSKNEMYKYMENIEKVLDRNYIKERTELYRDNEIKAILNVHGHSQEAVSLVKRIKKLTQSQFRRLIQSDSLTAIGFRYVMSREEKAEDIKAMNNAIDKVLEETSKK